MAQNKYGWGGRIRTSEWRDQNPLPYHLATPQHSSHLSHRTTCAGIRLLTIRGGRSSSARATHASHPWCRIPARPVAQAVPAHGPRLSLAGQPVRRMRRTHGRSFAACGSPTWRHPNISTSIKPQRPAPAALRAPAKHSAPEQRNWSIDQARAPRGARHRSRWHRARRYRNPFR